jgi:hypothetical protein
MARISITKSLPLDRINHCMLCDQPPQQTASLTLRYFPRESLLGKLLGPCLRYPRFLYSLKIPAFIGLIVLFVLAYRLLSIPLEALGSARDWVELALIFLLMTANKSIASFLNTSFFKRLRIESMPISVPLCRSHLYSSNLLPSKFGYGSIDLRNLHRSTRFDRFVLIELVALAALIGSAFLAALFDSPGSNAPVNLLMAFFVTAFVVAIINSLYLSWHRSKVFLIGTWDEATEQIHIDSCSDGFAAEVRKLSELQSNFESIHVFHGDVSTATVEMNRGS